MSSFKHRMSSTTHGIIFEHGLVKYGMTLDFNEDEIRVPDYDEIYRKALIPFTTNGLEPIRVNPKEANCVLRIFRDLGIRHNDQKFWFYGTDIYLKKGFQKFFSVETGKKINYSKFAIKYSFGKNDSETLQFTFVDYYLKIR